MANKSTNLNPRKLTWPQLNRIADILAYGPCHSLDGDGDLIAVGLVEFYDGDPEYIVGAFGAEEALYELPLFRVRDCWRRDEEPPAPEINCNGAKLQILYGSRTSSNSGLGTNHKEVE